jgi:hypothetical protein
MTTEKSSNVQPPRRQTLQLSNGVELTITGGMFCRHHGRQGHGGRRGGDVSDQADIGIGLRYLLVLGLHHQGFKPFRR